jgi:hypothetical protein
MKDILITIGNIYLFVGILFFFFTMDLPTAIVWPVLVVKDCWKRIKS